ALIDRLARAALERKAEAGEQGGGEKNLSERTHEIGLFHAPHKSNRLDERTQPIPSAEYRTWRHSTAATPGPGGVASAGPSARTLVPASSCESSMNFSPGPLRTDWRSRQTAGGCAWARRCAAKSVVVKRNAAPASTAEG